MSSSIVRYEAIDPVIQEKIKDYYASTWGNSIASECSRNIKAIKKAYIVSRQLMGQLGIGFGFVILDWVQDSKGIGVVSILPGNIPSSSFPVCDELLEVLARLSLISDDQKIPVMSLHTSGLTPSEGINLFYSDTDGSIKSILVDQSPFHCASVGIDPAIDEEIDRRNAKRQSAKPPKPTEQQKEDELYDWLRVQGVNVERQVKTSSNHFVDLWIPGKMMIEIKRGSVTANDVCQCIDYASEYSLPIVLIGGKITSNASRGLAGFNKLCPNQKICFVSWDIAHDYLRGKLLGE